VSTAYLIMAFRYTPLDRSKQEIRLIQLLPPSPSSHQPESDTIKCTLEHVFLDDAPEYLALSYVWGTPNLSRETILNGASIAVTENLEVALRHLRPEYSASRFWIDAISINQRDDDEKSWQIQMMRTIFTRAKMMIGWLGPASPDSDLAMDKFQEFADGFSSAKFPEEDILSMWDLDTKFWARIEADSEEGAIGRLVKDLDLPIPGREVAQSTVQALLGLLERPYWQRIWVLQEVAVSKKHLFICGNKSCLNFSDGFIFLFYHRHALKLRAQKSKTDFDMVLLRTNFDQRTYMMFQTWMQYHSDKLRSPKFGFLLKCVRPYKDQGEPLYCSDPRDVIYGILGLSSDVDKLGIEPDYSKPWQTVYIEAAKALLKQRNLDVLSQAHCLMSDSGLPSWVPDWSAQMRETLQPVHPVAQYNACAKAQGPCSISGSRDTIVLLGTRVDVVLQVGDVFPQAQSGQPYPDVPSIKAWLMELGVLSMLGGKIYGTQEKWKNALYRTPVTDLEFDIRYHSHRRINAPEDELLWMIGGKAPLLDANGEPSTIMLKRIDEFLRLVGMRAQNRRPFVTAQGYLGLGPADMKVDDVLVIFLGSDIPFMIRTVEKDEEYKLVGEAFTQGIMSGEFVKTTPRPAFDIFRIS
jgi:hypothetical protein